MVSSSMRDGKLVCKRARTLGAMLMTLPQRPDFRSSALTAPEMREPSISPFWLSRTQALSSKRIVRPSGRAIDFFVLLDEERRARATTPCQQPQPQDPGMRGGERTG
jgi:hypothetical protein